MKTNTTSSALFGVGAIQLIVGLLGILIYSSNFGIVDWLIALSFVLYFALSFLAKRNPLQAATVGACVYAAYLLFQAAVSPRLLLAGFILKAPAILLLIIAVWSVMRTKGISKGPPPEIEH